MDALRTKWMTATLTGTSVRTAWVFHGWSSFVPSGARSLRSLPTGGGFHSCSRAFQSHRSSCSPSLSLTSRSSWKQVCQHERMPFIYIHLYFHAHHEREREREGGRDGANVVCVMCVVIYRGKSSTFHNGGDFSSAYSAVVTGSIFMLFSVVLRILLTFFDLSHPKKPQQALE
jgi:hypothetical protein